MLGGERPSGLSTVLVTGASGFVGRAVVGHLVERGYCVIAASRHAVPSSPDGLEIRKLPLADIDADEAFDALLDGVDHVVHLAAIAHTRLRGEESRKAYHVGNFLLTKRLADAMARRPTGKLVYISSSRAQCGASFPGVLTETTPPEPIDDYGKAKLAGELAIVNALPPARFSILRPVLVYGPGVRGNFGTLLTLAALPLPLPFAALTAKRSLLDRDGLCRAISHCLEQPATDGGTFLVADAEPIAVHDIIGAIRHGLGKPTSLFVVPPALLGLGAALCGQGGRWQTLSQDLMASPLRLAATGWQPTENTAKAISRHLSREVSETSDT